jgi:hypothetical protein
MGQVNNDIATTVVENHRQQSVNAVHINGSVATVTNNGQLSQIPESNSNSNLGSPSNTGIDSNLAETSSETMRACTLFANKDHEYIAYSNEEVAGIILSEDVETILEGTLN